jgi:AraC-like DNA-binding protein
MATLALMLHSKFSELFKRTVGQSPGDYIIDWRILVAKGLLLQHKPVALARVFRKNGNIT